MKAVACLLLLGLAMASAHVVPYGFPYGYGYNSLYYGHFPFHGYYPGSCGPDGLYYNDAKSFVFCSNGNAYRQNCAPGTRNSGYGFYHYGKTYGYNNFCDVNLNDFGVKY